MSDSHRVHRAIKKAMKQVYPENPQGNLARHLETLAAMVSGIVLSQSCQLPKIASKIPGVVHPNLNTYPRPHQHPDANRQTLTLCSMQVNSPPRLEGTKSHKENFVNLCVFVTSW